MGRALALFADALALARAVVELREALRAAAVRRGRAGRQAADDAPAPVPPVVAELEPPAGPEAPGPPGQGQP
jgi:hypothetical protein